MRLQTEGVHGRFTGVWDCVVKTAKQEGLVRGKIPIQKVLNEKVYIRVLLHRFLEWELLICVCLEYLTKHVQQ